MGTPGGPPGGEAADRSSAKRAEDETTSGIGSIVPRWVSNRSLSSPGADTGAIRGSAFRAFRDRRDAGRRLAERLLARRDERPVLVALPRGGVPVAHEVARALGAPLDVIIVRKLGAPRQPELGLGAIGEGGVRVVSPEIMAQTGVSEAEVAAVEARERVELERRARTYRARRAMVPLEGRCVVIVADGIATGATMRAAIAVARAHGATRVVVATPIAPRDAIAALAVVADEVVALETPASFAAIGQFYDDFRQTTDSEVIELLDAAAQLD
jgi:putative phosphoribosyl transferase